MNKICKIILCFITIFCILVLTLMFLLKIEISNDCLILNEQTITKLLLKPDTYNKIINNNWLKIYNNKSKFNIYIQYFDWSYDYNLSMWSTNISIDNNDLSNIENFKIVVGYQNIFGIKL